MSAAKESHHVVIVGSGFGGLFAAQSFAGRRDVKITLIAKTDHHLFQPLLYQVATGILSEGEVAPATREILRSQRNVRVLLGLVDDIDLDARTVTSRVHDHVTVTPYDSLIVAAGAGQSYFGHDEFAVFAPGMKSIDDALELRSRIFTAFERAELEDDPDEVARLLTFVVVGAGATGVEMAGQIRELSTETLAREFRTIEPASARVILLDGGKEVLASFGEKLGGHARRSLEKLGVDVRLEAMVTDVDDSGVTVQYSDGREERIEAECKVWAAGVQASALGARVAEQSGSEVDRTGRVVVEPDLTLKGRPEVFVVGDLMAVPDVPGVAQGAIQSGSFAGSVINARLDRAAGRETEVPTRFSYWDKGSMAIISKFRGVASISRFQFSGFPAWAMWLFIHLLFLVGFKSRVSTLLRWAITFVSNRRAERTTTNQQLVGRLAMRELGAGVSGSLIRGETPLPKGKRRHN